MTSVLKHNQIGEKNCTNAPSLMVCAYLVIVKKLAIKCQKYSFYFSNRFCTSELSSVPDYRTFSKMSMLQEIGSRPRIKLYRYHQDLKQDQRLHLKYHETVNHISGYLHTLVETPISSRSVLKAEKTYQLKIIILSSF